MFYIFLLRHKNFEGYNGTWCCLLFLGLCLSLVVSSQLCDENFRKDSDSLAFVCADPDTDEGDKATPVIMLHGLTDLKETWAGIYQNLSTLTKRKVCIYDARNHGDSFWNDTINLDTNVKDLERFMDMLKIERAVLVGHSMGGVTVMKFAINNPSKVEGLFVEDITPYIPKSSYSLIAFFIRVLNASISAIPPNANETTAKTVVLDYLHQRFGNDQHPKSFYTYLPIHFCDDVWKWKDNFNGIIKSLKDRNMLQFGETNGTYEGKTFFIYGTQSFSNVGDHEEDIKLLFPSVKFVAVQDADHEVHYREEFMIELLKFLNE